MAMLVATMWSGVAKSQLPVRSWVDSVAVYGIENCLLPKKFQWQWHHAVMLNSVVHLYREAAPQQRGVYLDYIKECMDRTADRVHGTSPNVCAPGHGMAFLYGESGEQKYWDKALKVWYDYLLIPRAYNYGASHRAETVELWDDTIYMLGMYFLEMYRQTGNEHYIRELMTQYYAHKELLMDKASRLWVHGWDADTVRFNDKCSQLGWADKATGKSQEVWGRGYGWVVMTLADVLNVLPKSNPMWKEAARELAKTTKQLSKWQDPETGMWYQLPVRYGEAGNFLESSCSAMFAYGMTIGLKHGILKKSVYQPVVDKVYYGLRRYAMADMGSGHLSPDKVCVGTCIGDKEYYYNRQTSTGVVFAVGLYIMFGLEYEKLYGIRPSNTPKT